MVVDRRQFSGSAVPTYVTTGIDDNDLVIAINDATGWPDGSIGPFVATIESALGTMERILCDSRTGLNLTVNAAGRGWDDTTAQAHGSGIAVTIEHTDSAEFDDMIDEALARPDPPSGLVLADFEDGLSVTFDQSVDTFVTAYEVWVTQNNGESWGVTRIEAGDLGGDPHTEIVKTYTDQTDLDVRVYAINNGVYSESLGGAHSPDYVMPLPTVVMNPDFEGWLLEIDDPIHLHRLFDGYAIYVDVAEEYADLDSANAVLAGIFFNPCPRIPVDAFWIGSYFQYWVGAIAKGGTVPEAANCSLAEVPDGNPDSGHLYAPHRHASTEIHGIADTALLETTSGAIAKVAAAKIQAQEYAAQLMLVHGSLDGEEAHKASSVNIDTTNMDLLAGTDVQALAEEVDGLLASPKEPGGNQTLVFTHQGPVEAGESVMKLLMPFGFTIQGVTVTVASPPVGQDLVLNVLAGPFLTPAPIYDTAPNPTVPDGLLATALEFEPDAGLATHAAMSVIVIDIEQVGILPDPGSDMVVVVRYSTEAI